MTRTLLVIFGASQYPHIPQFEPRTAFATSALAFRELVTDLLAIDAMDVCNLFDSTAGVSDQLVEVQRFLSERAQASAVIVYHVGHGGFLADQEFYLVTRTTHSGIEAGTGIRAKALADVLREAFHGRVYVILDCCFAAAAVAAFQATGLGQLAERDLIDTLPKRGTALLVAASKDHAAMAPLDQDRTMFTGAFVDAISVGDANCPETLSLDDAADLTTELLRDRYASRTVRPEVHSPAQRSGDVARIPLFPNRARVAGARVPDPPQPRRVPRLLDRIFLSILALLVLGMGTLVIFFGASPVAFLGILLIPVLAILGLLALGIVAVGLTGAKQITTDKVFTGSVIGAVCATVAATSVVGQIKGWQLGETVDWDIKLAATVLYSIAAVVTIIGLPSGIMEMLHEERKTRARKQAERAARRDDDELR